MEYLNINLRLQKIKIEIFELGSNADENLISKLDSLRLINSLLKEQNRLLGIKHQQMFHSSAA